MKIFLQDIWKTSMDWDTEVADEEKRVWEGITNDAVDMDKMSVKRYVNMGVE